VQLAERIKQLLLKNFISRLLAAYEIPWFTSVLLVFKPVARQFVHMVREQPAQPTLHTARPETYVDQQLR
jgi:hypothetical protein